MYPFSTLSPATGSALDEASGEKFIYRITRANDADEHALNLSRWDQRYDQLSAGSFEGMVSELWLPKTQIFVERANRQLRQSCAAWHQSIWFGIPAAEDGMMSMGSKPLPENAICIRDGGAEFDLLTAPDFDLYGVVVDRLSFAEYLAQEHAQDLDHLLRQRDVIAVALSHKARLCAALSNVLDDARDNAQHASQELSSDLQARVFDALSGVLLGAHASTPAPRRQLSRQQTVTRIREHLLQNPGQPPSIPELCERLHLSRRALQNCVEEVTGMPPLSYMRSIRLNAVRRQLKYGHDGESVSSVAYAWGFNHLSQFAKDYRQLFGELPSAARQSAGH
jgi:AraC family transcriptional regulator, ethanolamine operon transcriptional activator